VVQTWIVRAGRDDKLERGLIAMSRYQVGDLTGRTTLADIRGEVDAAYEHVTVQSRREYSVQLLAFRSSMRIGDYMILLRGDAPDVAVGEVSGDYAYRPDLAGRHVRPVRWLRTDVRRSEVGADLLDVPALTSIYRVVQPGALARIEALLTAGPAVAVVAEPPVGRPPATAVDNLRRNLDYARSLATAGLHLQQLKVEAFEVSDVFRSAWVQAVAALDHWVHQEIRERMLAIAAEPAGAKSKAFLKFQLPISYVERVLAGELTLRDAIDQQSAEAFGRSTFQQPDKIRDGLMHVADVSQLWPRVAKVLTERATDGEAYDAKQVQGRLQAIVVRRNKIAHEWDEDPVRPPRKREIDAASTTQAIEWIGQLVEAMVVVLDTAP
jgi:restriction system protein